MELNQQHAAEPRSSFETRLPEQEEATDTNMESHASPRQETTIQGKSVEDWLQQYAQSVRQRQVRKRVGIGLAVTGSVIAVGAMGAFIGLSLIYHDWSHFTWLPGFTGFSGLTGFVGIGLYADAKQREAANALTETDDLRAVGPLAESLRFAATGLSQFKMMRRSQQALARLLPRLQAGDADKLNAYQRTCLYRHIQLLMKISYPPDEEALEFILAVLKALEQVGDRAAIPTVRHLLESVPIAWGDRYDRIRETAESCLQFLLTRIDQEDEGKNLLRAARMPDATPETLLRAAQSGAGTAPEQLLRSTAGTQSGLQD